MSVYYNDNNPYACEILRKNIKNGNLPEGWVDERDMHDISVDELREFNQWHLFAGIGGFPYGLRLAGFPDDYPILTGGWPCQPFSVAGKRRGKEDNRYLWPEMARLIEGLKPAVVFGENVPGIVKMGLDETLSDLEGFGYTTAAFSIPACAVDAPHLRQRIWIVAYSEQFRRRGWNNGDDSGKERSLQTQGSSSPDKQSNVADTDNTGNRTPKYRFNRNRQAQDERSGEQSFNRVGGCGQDVADTNIQRSQRHGRLQECTGELSAWACCSTHEDEWLSVAGIRRISHGIPNRIHRLKCLGNAVVPQVVQAIGEIILQWTINDLGRL